MHFKIEKKCRRKNEINRQVILSFVCQVKIKMKKQTPSELQKKQHNHNHEDDTKQRK